MRLGKVGFELECASVVFDGLGVLSLDRQGRAQIAVGQGEVGGQSERLLVVFDGLGDRVLAEEGVAQFEVGFDAIWLGFLRRGGSGAVRRRTRP